MYLYTTFDVIPIALQAGIQFELNSGYCLLFDEEIFILLINLTLTFVVSEYGWVCRMGGAGVCQWVQRRRWW